MVRIIGIVGAAGLAVWASVTGWRIYKAGFKRVVSVAQKAAARVAKSRKWLKARL